ncbi:MAG: hypothetical protein WC661_21940 [Opitutaceae bacterium]|jgi:hypothetical protein
MSNPTFSERFCEQHGIPREQYARAVFKRALYRRARPVAWLLPLLKRDYFAADFDLIYQIERIRRLRDFNTESERFHEHSSNRWWLRRRLLIRVSTSRLKNLIKATLPPSSAIQDNTAGGTAIPFESPPDAEKDFMASAGL